MTDYAKMTNTQIDEQIARRVMGWQDEGKYWYNQDGWVKAERMLWCPSESLDCVGRMTTHILRTYSLNHHIRIYGFPGGEHPSIVKHGNPKPLNWHPNEHLWMAVYDCGDGYDHSEARARCIAALMLLDKLEATE